MIRPLGDHFEGAYFDSESAHRYRAQVSLLPHSILVDIEERGQADLPYEEFRLAWDGAYGRPARLERAGRSDFFVFSGSDFVDSLGQRRPDMVRRDWWDLRLQGWTGIFAASGIVALLFAILYLWGLPLIAETAARFAPRAVEQRLGIAVVNILAPAPTRISDPAREQLLGKVLARLVKAAGSEYSFQVIYARLGMVNAFAAPGGIIVVSDSLVHLTQTPEELAGVLAHEMQHVIHKHSTRGLARQMGGRAILSLMAVDSAGTPLALEGVTKLVNLGYQRSDEEAADEEGVALLMKAGIDAGGLAAFLERIQSSDENGASRYLSTHPVTADRVARVKALARGHSSGTPLLTVEEWTKARMIGTSLR